MSNVLKQLNKTNSNVEFVTVEEAIDLIKNNGSTFFTVAFTKRSDNSLRVMNARLGVKKNLKGTGRNMKHGGLLNVYDMTKKNYRHVNISGIRWLSLKGKKYIITG